ncbi:MAG: hypothetical protein AABX33_07700 [Nanoarchaeota archaeon]
MSLIKLIKNNIGESYALGLFIIVLSVGIFSLAFMSEENKITGYAALGADMISAPAENNFPEFNDVDSLKTLAPGDYFIDDNGVVYWTGDSRMPAIAKVKEIDDAQKNRQIYIDGSGRIGYIVGSIPAIEKQPDED